METKLTKDLSVLTGISEQSLKKLADKSIYCICNSVEDLIYSRCDELQIDIGIGTLKILLVDNVVKYKFIPNGKLETAISKTIVNEQNELVDVLESALVGKIENVYKSFFFFFNVWMAN